MFVWLFAVKCYINKPELIWVNCEMSVLCLHCNIRGISLKYNHFITIHRFSINAYESNFSLFSLLSQGNKYLLISCLLISKLQNLSNLKSRNHCQEVTVTEWQWYHLFYWKTQDQVRRESQEMLHQYFHSLHWQIWVKH